MQVPLNNVPHLLTFLPLKGRTELPDNLKTLLRPVSMVVADFEFIAEISLYSGGFNFAHSLAQKIVACFKLASEVSTQPSTHFISEHHLSKQLSPQPHYHFGMRSVATAVATAIDFRRREPETAEDLLVIWALRESTVPKLIGEDMNLFTSLIRDLFPNAEAIIPENEDLRVCILKSLKVMGLQVKYLNISAKFKKNVSKATPRTGYQVPSTASNLECKNWGHACWGELFRKDNLLPSFGRCNQSTSRAEG